MKELREAINIESHIALQLNTLLCKCNVCNAIGNLYIFLTIFKQGKQKIKKNFVQISEILSWPWRAHFCYC